MNIPPSPLEIKYIVKVKSEFNAFSVSCHVDEFRIFWLCPYKIPQSLLLSDIKVLSVIQYEDVMGPRQNRLSRAKRIEEEGSPFRRRENVRRPYLKAPTLRSRVSSSARHSYLTVSENALRKSGLSCQSHRICIFPC